MAAETNLASIGRRNFLRAGVAGSGLLALGAFGNQALPWAAGAIHATPLPNYKRLIVINLLGGNDSLNTVVPLTLSQYAVHRPNLYINPGTALSLTGGPGTSAYGFHPAMVNLQGLWNKGEVALINKVGYPQQNLSHFVSEDIWSYGVRGYKALGGAAAGWVARFADLYAPTPMGVASVGVGRRIDFSGGALTPFMVDSLARFDFLVDWNYANNHGLRITRIRSILANQGGSGNVAAITAALENAHDVSGQVQQAVADYQTYSGTSGVVYPSPSSSLSRKLQDIAALIHGGFETKIYYTGIGGFDTHTDQLSRHDSLLQQLDGAIGPFVDDMTAMGVWGDIAIIVISEFGRRNYENGSAGTDHGHGNCQLVVGANVNGGMYGPDLTNADLDLEYLDYAVDFRDVYRNLIQDHLGFDPTPIFTESQPISATITVV